MEPSGSPFITVAAALELPALRRGLPEIVAGRDGLLRPIRWVHAGEVRNIASLLRGGELLLTTGMGVGTRAADQRRFVAELAARGVVALVIELGETFRGHLPHALIAAADRHGLPLIELHAEVPFVAVTETIHTAIVNRHYESLRRAGDLHERFTTLMLRGGGVPAVLALLADELGNPVFLEDHDGRLLYYAVPEGDDADPVAAWKGAAARAESLGVIAAVPAGEDHPAGRLLALPVGSALGPFAQLALDRAAGIVALAFLRTRQEDELIALGRGDLLASLAAGRVDPKLGAARARQIGFADGRVDALLPIVARLLTGGGRAAASASSPGVGGAWTPALRELERRLTAFNAPTLLGVDPSTGDLLLVQGLRDGGDRPAVAARAAEVVRDVMRERAVSVVVAAGPAADWAGVGAGLREAAESAAVASQVPGLPWYDATTMPLDRLLWSLRHDDDLSRYVERVLSPVLTHDASHRHPLLPTLEALCEHGGRRAETARALHLNRQALYDRLARLERVLGRDVSDPRALMELHLAIRARNIRDGVGGERIPTRHSVGSSGRP